MLPAGIDSEGVVKHQYVGDISDYRKYALLRMLSAGGTNRIGVCWMLTPSDGSSDGSKLTYLQQPERHRHFDTELFDILAHAAAKPDRRRLQTIEDSGAVRGARYYNELLPDEWSGRSAFMEQCAAEFDATDLVFFDPDNGLEVSLPKGRKNSSKYLYFDEVAAFYEAGKSLLIYQHFPRIERATFMASRSEQLRHAAPGCAVWAFTTAHVVFFLLVHPDSAARLAVAAMEACGRWDAGFIRGEYLSHNSPPVK
ncbi:hypothetical protein EET67_03080 [Pseudaminobacter arsenicus]|uniref:Uncharacterized protein n=1 Tax=Borborobacter arsenicus TaxID=1851146 RepID=A0A432VAF7_9HYPH|nr:hypothetical protein [Pseudaminobacter arsenicus]RUM99167.1 hypothetical protein EET67_03080 [Pseudaminobacter arsenicus]